MPQTIAPIALAVRMRMNRNRLRLTPTTPARDMSMNYDTFLERKSQLGGSWGFEPSWVPDWAFDFQKALIEWAVRKGRAAIFADCGLGKTPVQLVWAENVVRKSNGRVLVLTPLAVSHQTVSEAEKFHIEAKRCGDGKLPASKIIVTSYERLHHFDPADFVGCVCDESSILKNYDGATKDAITAFMLKLPYRLLCTATAAPNDYIELGTSSEALGELGYMDMLGRFFKNAQNSLHPSVYRHRGLDFNRIQETAKFRFRGHAEKDFWRWVCSWARAVRKPSDLGFDDGPFQLPSFETFEHVVPARTANPDFLFAMPAVGLDEQRAERRRTITERCEMAAKLLEHEKCAVSWCHLNDEGDLLEKLIDGAVQVSGKDSNDEKEEKFRAFETGQVRVLVTKGVIACYGLNWQHCNRTTFFPSHSFEQWYQAIRRFWRFGQTRNVRVDVIASEGEAGVLGNLQRKATQAEAMFASLITHMGDALKISQPNRHTNQEEIPAWLS